MKTILCLLSCLLALPAVAQIDCEIGIWFDEGGWIRGVDADPGTVAHAFLILSPTDGPILLSSLYQMVDATGSDGAWAEIRGGGVNAHTPWGDGDLTLDLEWAVPYEVDGPTVIADLYVPVGAAAPITLFASCDVFGTAGGAAQGWEHCTYCDMMPPRMTRAARINGGVPVEEKTTSWSAVKSVYR